MSYNIHSFSLVFIVFISFLPSDRSDLIETSTSNVKTIVLGTRDGNAGDQTSTKVSPARPSPEVDADKENETCQKKGGRGGKQTDPNQVIRPTTASATPR